MDSLVSLTDISKWNTSSNTTLNSMFEDCHLLMSLPDISKWKVDNVEDMSYFLSE